MKQPTVERRKELERWWDKRPASEKAHMKKLMREEDEAEDEAADDMPECEDEDAEDEAEAGATPAVLIDSWRLYGLPAAELPRLLGQIEAACGGYLVEHKGEVACVLTDTRVPGHTGSVLTEVRARRLDARMSRQGSRPGGMWLLQAAGQAAVASMW